MRNLEDIEKDLAAAREALSCVEGTPAEVYSRIVGYYRSVRNWNKGKREEYGERRLYCVKTDELHAAASPSVKETKLAAKADAKAATNTAAIAVTSAELAAKAEAVPAPVMESRLLLFVRASCPGCSPAKAAAVRLGIPVDLVNADTTDGMAEAVRRNVLSTPTAILISGGGEELKRARDADTIGRLLSA